MTKVHHLFVLLLALGIHATSVADYSWADHLRGDEVKRTEDGICAEYLDGRVLWSISEEQCAERAKFLATTKRPPYFMNDFLRGDEVKRLADGTCVEYLDGRILWMVSREYCDERARFVASWR